MQNKEKELVGYSLVSNKHLDPPSLLKPMNNFRCISGGLPFLRTAKFYQSILIATTLIWHDFSWIKTCSIRDLQIKIER